MLMLSASVVEAIRVLLNRRRTPDPVELRAAAEVLKHIARQVEGTITVEEAENQIAHKTKNRARDRMTASLGLLADNPAHRSILERIDPAKLQLPSPSSFLCDEDDLDDEEDVLDDEEFDGEEEIGNQGYESG